MNSIKEILRLLIYIVKQKPYKIKLYNGSEIEMKDSKSMSESFFGYYDKSPEQNGNVLFHVMGNNRVSIIVKDIASGDEKKMGESSAFNWQMGTRALWIDDDTISCNDFEDGMYVCKWYSISQSKVIKTLPMPLMDIYQKDYVLTTNYQRLRSVDPDYSYQCLPEMDDNVFKDYEHDGIWRYDLHKDEKQLLLSIKDVLSVKKERLYEDGRHCINHIMIAPDGKSFMFIHRYRYGGKKYDRLMVYDFKELRCLLDDPLQSHFCWLDNHTIMGYCGCNGETGWFQADTISGEVHKLEELTKVHPKNGHPTPHGDWIVVDGYPDMDRMQRLHAYNQKTKDYILLAEFFHDIKHHNYNRCDLHPRFTPDGKAIYVDTIYNGKRQLCQLKMKLD